ncbi:MAG: V-type ATP synthase subunit D [Candidatus Peregrinibacteria bacterium]|nr:V-type ATP synthase subunit D [Candidatus Peregrinibacteria bacterium]MDZ4245288.1 V-type ATP synthase subunit D [Candidatus Gracilibacteria bacterium]
MTILAGYSPTKMALLELKSKHSRAKKGHKLLNDKQEGLMAAFMEIIREAQKLREEAEKNLGSVFTYLLLASGSTAHPEFIEAALLKPTMSAALKVEVKNIMSVKIAEMTAEFAEDKGGYGFLHTTGELDTGLEKLKEFIPTLVKLAAIEKKAERMADELQKTRRRVNALEHVMIPNLQDTMKFIQQALDEKGRMEKIVSMIVKAKTAA